MNAQELREKRSEILSTLLDRFTADGGYALGPIVDALDAFEALDTQYAETTTPQLKRLLSAFRADQEGYLHEGRTPSRPPLDEYAQRIQAVFAASLHDVKGGA